MKDLIIIGAGGFGREVLEIALDIQEQKSENQWRVKGFITDIPGDFYEKDTLGYEIIDNISDHKISKNAVYAFAIADIPFKIKTTEQFIRNGAEFINLIHPSAVIGRTVKMGVGNIISPRVTMTANINLGNFIRVGGGTSIGHDVKIGDYSSISGTCGINGYVELGQGVFLGSHATICPHAKIGAYASVGAGTIVLRRVKAETKVFGNPAKKMDF